MNGNCSTNGRTSLNILLGIIGVLIMVVGGANLPASAAGLVQSQAPVKINDSGWAEGFHLPSIQGTVNAVVADHQNNTYFAGDFHFAGDVKTNNIVMWNGTSWSALDNGINGTVRALAIDSDNNLYVGGSFNEADGAPGNYIAKWDGLQWSALGEGVGTTSGIVPDVRAIVVDNGGFVYAGGSFTSAGGLPANRIARWDGNSWTQVGEGIGPSNVLNSVDSLTFDNAGNLYAGGYFLEAGNVQANFVAIWNGIAWSAVGDGTNDYVSDLVVDSSDTLYARGDFTVAGGTPVDGVAKWNGVQWTAVERPPDSLISSFAIDQSGNLIAGLTNLVPGSMALTRIAQWNGTTWLPVSEQAEGGIRFLVQAVNNDYYVVGVTSTDDGKLLYGNGRWNGANWSALGAGNGLNNDVVSLAFSGDDGLVAGGRMTIAGEAKVDQIARWNGLVWSPVGQVPQHLTDVRAVAIDGEGNLYAGGGFFFSPNHEDGVIEFDGAAWHGLGAVDNAVLTISTQNSGTLYAGGYFDIIGWPGPRRIARWSGSEWSELGSGFGEVDGVWAIAARIDNEVYAGGQLYQAEGNPVHNIAKWNGTNWSELGDGLNGRVLSLQLDNAGGLFAGGEFTSAGNIAVSHIAKWDGSSWSPLGAGVNGTVRALALSPDGSLYVGGDFTSAGNMPAAHIAKWNGTQWTTLGSGLDGSVNALVVDNTDGIFVGGEFTSAGETVSLHIAHWSLQPTVVETTSFRAESPSEKRPAISVTNIALLLALVTTLLVRRRLCTYRFDSTNRSQQ